MCSLFQNLGWRRGLSLECWDALKADGRDHLSSYSIVETSYSQAVQIGWKCIILRGRRFLGSILKISATIICKDDLNSNPEPTGSVSWTLTFSSVKSKVWFFKRCHPALTWRMKFCILIIYFGILSIWQVPVYFLYFWSSIKHGAWPHLLNKCV